ncbi:MAG: 2-hydroxyacyl-CoA dehydratase, partial [Chloroflexi bacterium]|nr:2-hydroxyacyl-CoA dehydratase [Chloroflexota bacterium]
AAVLPIHYPRALLRAFDILPVEVWGPPNVDATQGAAHLQPYICSIVRNALAFLMSGGLDATDCVIVPHTCDSLQGFASILIDFIMPSVIASEAKQSPKSDLEIASSQPFDSASLRSGVLLAMTKPVLPIYLPRDQRASDADFLANEFRALYRRLAEITNRAPSDADLLAQIARDEDADALLADLHARRADLPLTQIEFYRVIRAREFLPTEDFSALARDVLARASESPQRADIPIILSGIVPEPMSIFDSISQMGGTVVADDLAGCGRRLYPRGTHSDPFARMAERIINAPPDSTRGNSIQARLDHLTRLTRESGAHGIVFYDVKFCETELFYLPALRKMLQDQGVPSVAIEFDLNDAFSQQTATRLEAFIEMLG